MNRKRFKRIGSSVALVFVFVTTACAQSASINGNIRGLKETLMTVYYNTPGGSKTDSIEVVNGTFKWMPALSVPQKVNLFFGKQHLQLYVENSNILINGSADAIDKVKITGSAIQDEADQFVASLKYITDQEKEISTKYRQASKEEQAAMEMKYEGLAISKKEKAAEYISSHPKSFFSLSLVIDLTFMGKYEELKNEYDRLDGSLRETREGKVIADRLAILKRSAPGSPILDFTQNNTEGKPVHFSAFRGKYVLVDFWASWCAPCRGENPNVLKAYNTYKDKNFTVVGISLDDKKESWEKAIREDGIPWTQLSDLKGLKNEVSVYYGIQGIPSTLLVDPEGKIIAKDLRGERLNKALEKLFN